MDEYIVLFIIIMTVVIAAFILHKYDTLMHIGIAFILLCISTFFLMYFY
jgi:hypothetical protein